MTQCTNESNESLKIQRTIELPNNAQITISCIGLDNINEWSRQQLSDLVDAWKKNNTEMLDEMEAALSRAASRLMEQMSVPMTNLIGKEASEYIVSCFLTGSSRLNLQPYKINEQARNNADQIALLHSYINKAIEYGYVREEIWVWNGKGQHKNFGNRKKWEECVADGIKEGIPYNPVTGEEMNLEPIEIDDFNPAPTMEQRIREAMESEMIPMYYATDKYKEMFEGF